MMNDDEKLDYLMNVLKRTPRLVNNNIIKNNQRLNKRNDYYDLKENMDVFLKEDTDNRFYIMPGLRGVGKTTIIFQLYDYLVNSRNIDSNQILYLDLDRLKDQGNFNILDFLDLFIKNINEESYLNNSPLFIFVDESQYSHNWDHIGKIIFNEYKNVFLIFTGSYALNLETAMESARRSLKKEIYPLNFSQYLNLKYGCELPGHIDREIFNMIFSGNIENMVKLEKNIELNIYNKFERDSDKIWKEYLQYGEFPSAFNKKTEDIIQTTLDMKNRIIEKDMDLVSSLTAHTKRSCYSLLNILALQKPGSLSLQKLAKNLEIPKKTAENILAAFMNTHMIFKIEPYGSISKRNRQPWEYYFLSTQMKACIYQHSGQSTRSSGDYFGILAENLVASSLFIMKEKTKSDFGIFYDSRKENNVDFLINTVMGDIIPIEVGFAKKNKRQISDAIRHYGCEHGIVISNTTKRIKKDDNVIFMPLKTFSMM